MLVEQAFVDQDPRLFFGFGFDLESVRAGDQPHIGRQQPLLFFSSEDRLRDVLLLQGRKTRRGESDPFRKIERLRQRHQHRRQDHQGGFPFRRRRENFLHRHGVVGVRIEVNAVIRRIQGAGEFCRHLLFGDIHRGDVDFFQNLPGKRPVENALQKRRHIGRGNAFDAGNHEIERERGGITATGNIFDRP
ncbi:hypothetical protein SDC9_191029 [bioreactor metagenome]|uniref:Uncharacterized protein n=1 Tax=bioreactor metagenome TaxID=1076179 RepID=A0A645HZ52_9ZZZZ